MLTPKEFITKIAQNRYKNRDMKSFSTIWRKLRISQLRRAESNIISGVISTVAQAARIDVEGQETI